MQSACLKIPWKLEGNDLKLSITKVFSLKALWKDLHNALSIFNSHVGASVARTHAHSLRDKSNL